MKHKKQYSSSFTLNHFQIKPHLQNTWKERFWLKICYFLRNINLCFWIFKYIELIAEIISPHTFSFVATPTSLLNKVSIITPKITYGSRNCSGQPKTERNMITLSHCNQNKHKNRKRINIKCTSTNIFKNLNNK